MELMNPNLLKTDSSIRMTFELKLITLVPKIKNKKSSFHGDGVLELESLYFSFGTRNTLCLEQHAQVITVQFCLTTSKFCTLFGLERR